MAQQIHAKGHGAKKRYNYFDVVEWQIALVVQGVFFNWAHPEFAKCRPVSNRFQKNDRVPDWPPL